MPRYYNKTRGPLPLSLPSGTTVVAAKSFIDIDRKDEGCSSVAKYVKKGFLAPPKRRPAPAPAPAPEKPEPAPVVAVASPEPEPAEPASEPELEPSSSEEEKSSKKKSRKRTRR
jgi:hypothetical protein